MSNALERNAANAVISVLSTDGTLAAIPPREWNSEEGAAFPRLSVKCTQQEEMVFLHGLYRVDCEVKMVTRVTDDMSDLWMQKARALTTDIAANTIYGLPGGAEVLISDDHFQCLALEPRPASNSTDADKRTQILHFSLVGFDKDRFTA